MNKCEKIELYNDLLQEIVKLNDELTPKIKKADGVAFSLLMERSLGMGDVVSVILKKMDELN